MSSLQIQLEETSDRVHDRHRVDILGRQSFEGSGFVPVLDHLQGLKRYCTVGLRGGYEDIILSRSAREAGRVDTLDIDVEESIQPNSLGPFPEVPFCLNPISME